MKTGQSGCCRNRIFRRGMMPAMMKGSVTIGGGRPFTDMKVSIDHALVAVMVSTDAFRTVMPADAAERQPHGFLTLPSTFQDSTPSRRACRSRSGRSNATVFYAVALVRRG